MINKYLKWLCDTIEERTTFRFSFDKIDLCHDNGHIESLLTCNTNADFLNEFSVAPDSNIIPFCHTFEESDTCDACLYGHKYGKCKEKDSEYQKFFNTYGTILNYINIIEVVDQIIFLKRENHGSK